MSTISSYIQNWGDITYGVIYSCFSKSQKMYPRRPYVPLRYPAEERNTAATLLRQVRHSSMGGFVQLSDSGRPECRSDSNRPCLRRSGELASLDTLDRLLCMRRIATPSSCIAKSNPRDCECWPTTMLIWLPLAPPRARASTGCS